MIPIIAIVGRPNVGKSTLFNRLTRSHTALIANRAGVTRDRIYGQGYWRDKPFVAIDTGGLAEVGDDEDAKAITELVAKQSWQAIHECDAALFIVDARSGLTAIDQQIAKQLRRSAKRIFVAVNKTEGLDLDNVLTDFYAMGLGELYPIAASHGHGVDDLIADVFAVLKKAELAEKKVVLTEEKADLTDQNESEKDLGKESDEESEKETDLGKSDLKKESTTASVIKLAIIGRPNVGKSTLVNRLLGEERVIVYDQPGTTRDSIEVPLERHGKHYILIDTAGVRRRSRISEDIEKNSIVKTLQAIEAANVVLFMIDARQNVAEQDMHLLGFIIEAGKALVIAVNKWDKLPIEQKDEVRRELDRRLSFVDFAKTHFISARHGTGVGELFPLINAAYRSATQKMSTPRLTRILEDAIVQHQPPIVKGRRIKLRYAHPGGYNPPRIIIHGNQADDVPDTYRRYLSNVFRKALKLEGTPVFIEVKSGKNPFAGRKNKLTEKQLQKRKRLLSHVKKK